MSGNLIRTTLNLSPGTQTALETAASVSGDSKTNVINKAIRFYARALNADANGGEVLVRQRADADLHRIEFI
jgi:hypothetical protein